MRRLVFWLEKGLSNVDEARSRYDRILNDENLVVFEEFDTTMRQFALQASEQYPGVRFGAQEFEDRPGGSTASRHYSRHGIVIEIDDSLPRNLIAKLYEIATPLGLTIYNMQSRYVLGVDDDLGVTTND